MSAAVTAAATASIIASQDVQEALEAQRSHEERVYDCSLYVEGFEHNKASVEQIHAYTECAELLYPEPEPVTDQGSNVLAEVSVLTLLIALVVGVIYGYKEDRIGGAVFFGLVFPIVLLLAFAFVLSIVYGAVFVLS